MNLNQIWDAMTITILTRHDIEWKDFDKYRALEVAHMAKDSEESLQAILLYWVKTHAKK